ncbi:MAG: hypothetical protein LCH37_12865 [Bacteroidetes bacterium]|nr:hypothetical protein [Bacteroidota bacterium]
MYSILPEGEEETLFEKFVAEYHAEFKEELSDILKRLMQIGHNTGAREIFFKHEGDHQFLRKFGKQVWALYDEDDRNLRLYCIRFASVALILGGGGFKTKSVKKWQEDEKLAQEVRLITAYAEHIFSQLASGELFWSKD